MANINMVVPGSVGYFLIKNGAITEEQLFEALKIQEEEKGLIGHILVNLGYCREADVARAIEMKTGCKYVSVEEVGINFALANSIPADIIAKHGILPLYQDEKKLFVVMRNPNDVVTRDNLSIITGGMEIVPLITTDTELTAAINTIVNNASAIDTYDEEEVVANLKARVIDLVFPIIVLIAICVYGLYYIGQSGGLSFADAFGNTDATVGLPWGGLIALVVIVIYFIARGLVTFKEAMACIPKGFNAMVPAILILTMATSLKNMTGLLDSDAFVKGALAGASGLNNFLPAIIFLVACGISFATGTSWGTFGILIPIVTSIFDVNSALGIMSMSACLAGSVCGDHCSPISDTTIMSSAGAQCNHINHVSTQLPYAITVAGISFVSYIIAAFIQNAWISLAISTVLTIGTLFVIKMVTAKKA